MGRGTPTSKAPAARDLGAEYRVAPSGSPPPPGAPAEPPTAHLGTILAKTLAHFFPQWRAWLRRLRDRRDPTRIIYPPSFLVTTGLLLFLLKLGARRQLRFACATPAMLDNVNSLADTRVAQIEHPDTLEYFLGKLPARELPRLLRQMVQRLIRMKCLDRFRVAGYFLVAIDATGVGSYHTRHCDQCLTYQHGDATVYAHLVLDAKLVTANGMAISLLTEFVENTDSTATTQDCELKAFYRLAHRLKQAYPQLRLCLVLDSLYMCAPVLKICREAGWAYIITFKPGSMRERWEEYELLRMLVPEQSHEVPTAPGRRQEFTWVEGLEVGAERTNILECCEVGPQGTVKRFVWATSHALTAKTVAAVAASGRLRWKIENEGYNEQKNGGYHLEHAYSEDPTVAKNYYLLLQIGQMLEQLLQKGSLLRHVLGSSVRQCFGGVRKLAEFLHESLRIWVLPAEVWEVRAATDMQIRLDTS